MARFSEDDRADAKEAKGDCMSKFTTRGGAYGFRCKKFTFCGDIYWRMSWVVDYYGDRLRYPRRFTRDTDDIKAAERFCKRHDLAMP